ncbi:MAG: hypothetical protein Q7T56_10265 [Nocardioidaceae bacterium]|nr:hypothetical protein [Nocardioidaceae bacterium]
MPDDLLIPAGHRLLHIGPPKTATTAVQSGFHHNRESLAEQGVHYAGPGRQPMAAALAVATGRRVPGFGRDSEGRWDELVEEVRAARAPRVVVSSEFFADGDDDAVARVLDGLGAGRTRVVVTLRSVAQILPSQWQQLTQDRWPTPYDEWLHRELDGTLPDGTAPGFWRRHRHDVLVRRWAEAVGPENLTVVLAERSEPDRVVHVFEDMAGLRRGTLQPSPEDANRSLTAAEAALTRAISAEFRRRDDLDERAYHYLYRYGLASYLKQRETEPDEEPVTTPTWAVERAQQVGADAAEVIAGLGVRVIGDLGSLTEPPRAVGDAAEPDVLPVDLAARAAIGVGLGALRLVDRRERVTARKVARETRRQDRAEKGVRLREASVREIVGELRRRARR